MTIPVANVNLANTFSHWLTRTNELAQAMSLNCVTVGGNAAVGNAVVHGVFSANTGKFDVLKGFSSGNVALEDTILVVANTAAITSIGAVNIKGAFVVDSVSTMKIAGSNATHQVLSAVDANGTMGFIKVEFPLDQLTDVDTSNVADKDNETIMKWNDTNSRWEANTLSLINSTRINTLNVGTISSTLVVTANANISNNTMFINGTNRRVGIGTAAPTAALSVNGAIIATGDISGFQTSDIRFKDNIVEIDTGFALTRLMSLEVSEFDWIAEEVAKNEYVSDLNEGRDVGLIAQQVQKIFPKAVITRPDGTLAVDYTKLIPYMIASIQYLRTH